MLAVERFFAGVHRFCSFPNERLRRRSDNSIGIIIIVIMADWSPFSCLPEAGQTASGLLLLDGSDQEVELLRRTQLELRHEGTDPMAPRPLAKAVVVMGGGGTGTGGVGGTSQQQEWSPRSTGLTLTVTTHRLVLAAPTNSNNSNSSSSSSTVDMRFLHLSNVHTVAATGGPSLQSPFATYKLTVSTYTYGDVLFVFRNGAGYSAQRADRDATHKEVERALQRRQWETQQRLQDRAVTEAAAVSSRRRVGVDHVMTKNRVRHKQAAKLAEEALSGDAEQLLQEASALLGVIQRYTVLLERHGGDGNGDDDDESAKKLAGLLSDMGMTSALSKSQVVGGTAGGGGGGSGVGGAFRGVGGGAGASLSASQRDYYELTARQVADFLLPKLAPSPTKARGDGRNARGGSSRSSSASDSTGGGNYGTGIMTLTDVYCLFNRARGTNLISPEDLREACALLGGLNVGLSQRTFPSGVIVVQLDALALVDDGGSGGSSSSRQRLLDLCPTTALEASHVLRLSPLLASEQLEEAERLGWVCRDATLESVRFYPNRFDEWAATAAAVAPQHRG